MLQPLVDQTLLFVIYSLLHMLHVLDEQLVKVIISSIPFLPLLGRWGLKIHALRSTCRIWRNHLRAGDFFHFTSELKRKQIKNFPNNMCTQIIYLSTEITLFCGVSSCGISAGSVKLPSVLKEVKLIHVHKQMNHQTELTACASQNLGETP